MRPITRIVAGLSTLLLWGTAGFAEEPSPQHPLEVQTPQIQEQAPTQDSGISVAGIPALSYSSDSGFGFGVVGSLFKKEEGVAPYKYAIDLLVFLTTSGMHDHKIAIDAVDVGKLPLRLTGKTGFFATLNQNFCGTGISANCNEALAVYQADTLGLQGNNRAEFIQHYFQMRYMEIFGTGHARWRLHDLPHKVEAVVGWRGSYYMPGHFSKLGPYPGSLFEQTIGASGGQRGFAGVYDMGFMFDGRDHEIVTTSGYWAEAMGRFSVPVLGSNWLFGGVNLTARGYLPLIKSHKLVWANQGIIDLMMGDAPLEEIVRIGNSSGYTAFGGSSLGRGMRDQMFPGRIKAIAQSELRYTFPGFNLWAQHFDPGIVGFVDGAMIAWDFKELKQSFNKANRLPFTTGFGAGGRLTWNESLTLRVDVGVSPDENFSPKFYIKVKNVF